MRLAIKQLAPAKASSHPRPRSPFETDAEPLPAPSAEPQPEERLTTPALRAGGRCARGPLSETRRSCLPKLRENLRAWGRKPVRGAPSRDRGGAPDDDAAVAGLAWRTAPCPWLVSLAGRVTLRAAEMLRGPRALAAAPLHRPLAPLDATECSRRGR